MKKDYPYTASIYEAKQTTSLKFNLKLNPKQRKMNHRNELSSCTWRIKMTMI